MHNLHVPEASLIANLAKQHGGQALLVGGCVRDHLLNLQPKDIDIEVYGIDAKTLESLLSKHFSVEKIGKSFGVFLLKGHDIDVSIPRTESKIAPGHKGFDVTGDPSLSPEQASLRRDFTINSILYDPLTNSIIDPHNGQNDLKNRILKHVSPQFSEDPLRVLRAMQLIGRFELTPHPDTLKLCKSITPENLPKERIFDEWAKLLTKSTKPSLGLNFLRDTHWIQYYPELEALINCPQDPAWHPEGDVWNHTLHCLDDFAKNRINDYFEDLVVGFAVLCHDLGKPSTTFQSDDGHIRSPRHDSEGVHISKTFLQRFSSHKDLIESIIILVETHMRPMELVKVKASEAAIRRLVNKVQRMDRLMRVVSADSGGRPPLTKDDFHAGEQWIQQKLEELNLKDSTPQPLILGRHLIALGLEPSPKFKKILNHCFEAQLDGEFQTPEEADQFLKNYFHSENI